MTFTKTRHTNLVRNNAGIYFIRAHVGGRLIRASLKTNIESEAVIRRDMRLARARQDHGLRLKTRFAVGGLLDAFLERSRASRDLKPKTKAYHVELVALLHREWPELRAMDAAKVTSTTLRHFFDRMAEDFSATRHNGCLDVLRDCFKDAIKLGVRYDNPASLVDRMKPSPRRDRVPSAEDFKRLCDDLESRWGVGGLAVRFLALSGGRIEESRQLLRTDVDFKAEQIRFRAETTKNGEEKTIPFLPGMKELLEELFKIDGERKRFVLPVQHIDATIERACKRLGIPHFSPHDLRHMFTTVCIEAGVDIPTLARWLGHKDGGALLLKRYNHLRDEHSKKQAEKVKLWSPHA